MMNAIQTKKEKGFTLIELVMVIVILGILAAFALPRFADLGGEARKASIDAASGAVKSASAIAHSAWLAKGKPTTAIDLEGSESINMSTNGYPEADGKRVDDNVATFGIATAAELSSEDYGLSADGGVLTVTLGECSFDYTEGTGSVSAISDSDTNTEGC